MKGLTYADFLGMSLYQMNRFVVKTTETRERIHKEFKNAQPK